MQFTITPRRLATRFRSSERLALSHTPVPKWPTPDPEALAHCAHQDPSESSSFQGGGTTVRRVCFEPKSLGSFSAQVG